MSNRKAHSAAAKQKPNTECAASIEPCPLKMEVRVVTSAGNPVINVDVTVSFNDQSKRNKATDKEGIAEFKPPPKICPA